MVKIRQAKKRINEDCQNMCILIKKSISIHAPHAIERTLCLIGGAFVLQARSRNIIIAFLRNGLTASNLQLAARQTELTESNANRALLKSVMAELKCRERSSNDDAFLKDFVEAYVSNEEVLQSSISKYHRYRKT